MRQDFAAHHDDRPAGDPRQSRDARSPRSTSPASGRTSARRRSRAARSIDRVIPLAFGVIFALTGSIGPILGQNLGARLMGRVQRAVMDALILSVGYALVAWAVLAFAAPPIVCVFDAHWRQRRVSSLFFCRYGAAAWVFITCLFVANTAFNNLGFPLLAMLFNWGRATLGTIPFVALGARWGGVEGAMLGIAAGAAIFGLGAAAPAYRRRCASRKRHRIRSKNCADPRREHGQ